MAQNQNPAGKTMAALIRSEAAFDERLVEFGVIGDVAKSIKEKGWTTMNSFLFACGFNPKAETDDTLKEMVIKKVTNAKEGDKEEHILANNLSQLYWECTQAMIADTRYRHDHSMADVPKPLHAAERNARRVQFQKQFAMAIPDIMTWEL